MCYLFIDKNEINLIEPFFCAPLLCACSIHEISLFQPNPIEPRTHILNIHLCHRCNYNIYTYGGVCVCVCLRVKAVYGADDFFYLCSAYFFFATFFLIFFALSYRRLSTGIYALCVFDMFTRIH